MTDPRDGSGGWDALVVAGGAARRLGGRDKAVVDVHGRTLLERVLAAVAGAGRVVVVGPPRPLPPGTRPVRWTREDPPGGGPLAAVAAGLPLVGAPLVAVLAVDLPFVTGREIDALRRAVVAPGTAAAVLADPDGHLQPLIAMWRTEALRAAMPPDPAGRSLRSLLRAGNVRRVPASARACLDCDDPAALALARAWAAGAPGQPAPSPERAGGGAAGPSLMTDPLMMD